MARRLHPIGPMIELLEGLAIFWVALIGAFIALVLRDMLFSDDDDPPEER